MREQFHHRRWRESNFAVLGQENLKRLENKCYQMNYFETHRVYESRFIPADSFSSGLGSLLDIVGSILGAQKEAQRETQEKQKGTQET